MLLFKVYINIKSTTTAVIQPKTNTTIKLVNYAENALEVHPDITRNIKCANVVLITWFGIKAIQAVSVQKTSLLIIKNFISVNPAPKGLNLMHSKINAIIALKGLKGALETHVFQCMYDKTKSFCLIRYKEKWIL